MATKRLLNDVAKVFVPLGEDAQGKQIYRAYTFNQVYCTFSSGTTRKQSGTSADDTLTMYVFDAGSTITRDDTNLDVAETCEHIFGVLCGTASMADDDSKIYIVPYNAGAIDKPPQNCQRVSSVKRLKAGSKRMWHWEVHAR